MDVAVPEDPSGLAAPVRTADSAGLLEQYKVAVEMADRISARRGATNAFFVTVSSALLAAAESFDLPVAALLGIVLAGAWWLLLRSYRRLNTAKFVVINKLETGLAAQPFTEEWEILKAREDPIEDAVNLARRLTRSAHRLGRYPELSIVEQVVPAIFAILYFVLFISEVT